MDNNYKTKFSSLKKFFPAGITAFFVILGGIFCFFTIYKIDAITDFFKEVFTILQPIIFGIVFAYVLNPISTKIEEWLKLIPKRKNEKLIKNSSLSRGLSVGLSLVFAILMIFVILYMIIPELISSITGLISDMPSKIDGFLEWTKQVLGENNALADMINNGITQITEISQKWIEENLITAMQTWLGFFILKAKDVVSVILNLVVGFIVSVYILTSKEKFAAQFKKFFYAVLKPQKGNLLFDVLSHSNKIFGGFVTGKLIDSLIIGVLCFIIMSILRLPYTLLISVIVGVTNIIPFFGPFIGAIPSAFLILLVNPMQCLYFIILILALQQLDGNVIGPKILGDSTGLSPFWVVFSILLSGGLFGFLGMVLGVPVFGVIYYLVRRYIDHVLRKNNMPVETESYMNLFNIEENGKINYKK